MGFNSGFKGLIAFQYCCVDRGRAQPADALFSVLFALKLGFCFISSPRAFNYRTKSNEEMSVWCGASRVAILDATFVMQLPSPAAFVAVFRDVLVVTAVHWLLKFGYRTYFLDR